MDTSRLAELLKGAKEDYSQLADAYPNAAKFVNALRGNIEQNVPTTQELNNPEYMQQRALNYMSPMAGAIKAYHGTPHEFDRFDMSKIGTGEGAQAYGHGLYFAQNPNVAETYLSANNPFARHAFMALDYANGDINKAIKNVEKDLKLFEQNKENIMPDTLEKYQSSLNILKAKKSGKDLNLGNIYDVDIKWPDPAREAADPLSEHHLLDWDKPLSEQPHVQKIMSEYMLATPKMTGEQAWKSAINQVGIPFSKFAPETGQLFATPEAASQRLNEIGIPGIKYLDQGSRDMGGTSNYVMFGDEYPQIVNRANSLSELLRGK